MMRKMNRVIPIVCLLGLAVLIPGSSPAHAASSQTCKPAYPDKDSKCSDSNKCCSGLICVEVPGQLGGGQNCQPGCRIDRKNYAPGASNPANPCETCQPSISTTRYSPLSGTGCNDGNACTTRDACQAGVCTGNDPVFCAATDQCHMSGVCNPATGACSDPARPDGTGCDDATACTRQDSCQAGVCTGSDPVTCTASDQCHAVGVCDPATGACSNPAVPFGTGCNDSNACTVNEFCLAGGCGILPPVGVVHCDPPANECQTSTCHPLLGCLTSPAADGTLCNDNNLCTQSSICVSGTCTGTPAPCSSCRQDSTCDPTNGLCGPVKANGTACNDGNIFTTGDSCTEGICVGAPCSETQAACPFQGCMNILTDNNNCGACGNVCSDSVCFQGSCVDGCSIGGIAYRNGVRNPGNDCQGCDTSLSRTEWTLLGGGSGVPVTCKAGCGTGICASGLCGLVVGGSACTDTECATGACDTVTNSCVFTPKQGTDGCACTPNIALSPCNAVSGVGACSAGQCVGAAANEGKACAPPSYGGAPADRDCYSKTYGSCVGGTCRANILLSSTPCNPSACTVGHCEADPSGQVPLICQETGPRNCNDTGEFCPAGTCDAATACVLPRATNGANCGDGLIEGYHPERCCSGQTCVCSPSDWSVGGLYNICATYECWYPDQIPPHQNP